MAQLQRFCSRWFRWLQDEDDGCSVAHGFAGAVDLLQVGGARRWKMVMVVRETSFHGGAACSGSQVRWLRVETETTMVLPWR